MKAQMKRGVLEMCMLYQFLSRDYYGYDIMMKMKTKFPDVKDSSFYVILQRLNREGYTQIYYGKESNGPQRKYYRITEKGKKYLEEAVGDWKELKKIVEEIGIV